MIHASIWRLATSRFWWLFVAICSIVYVESAQVVIPVTRSKADLTTIVIIEVLSAYATSGISLCFPGVPYSFSGMLTPYSKTVIMIAMFAGRHRGMDLGP